MRLALKGQREHKVQQDPKVHKEILVRRAVRAHKDLRGM